VGSEGTWEGVAGVVAKLKVDMISHFIVLAELLRLLHCGASYSRLSLPLLLYQFKCVQGNTVVVPHSCSG